MLAAVAYDGQHARVCPEAWAAQDAQTGADSIVLVFTTSGDDRLIVTDD